MGYTLQLTKVFYGVALIANFIKKGYQKIIQEPIVGKKEERIKC